MVRLLRKIIQYRQYAPHKWVCTSARACGDYVLLGGTTAEPQTDEHFPNCYLIFHLGKYVGRQTYTRKDGVLRLWYHGYAGRADPEHIEFTTRAEHQDLQNPHIELYNRGHPIRSGTTCTGKIKLVAAGVCMWQCTPPYSYIAATNSEQPQYTLLVFNNCMLHIGFDGAPLDGGQALLKFAQAARAMPNPFAEVRRAETIMDTPRPLVATPRAAQKMSYMRYAQAAHCPPAVCALHAACSKRRAQH